MASAVFVRCDRRGMDCAAESLTRQIYRKNREGLPMLRSLKDLENYKVSATDGDIGDVVNFLLDDERWTVREYETRLYDYYGRPVYWGSDDRIV